MLDVPSQYMKLSSAASTNVISDFFIMRKYRHKGLGREAAFRLFDQYRGTWEIRQTLSNHDAYQFWRRLIEKYKGDEPFRDEIVRNDRWNGPVLVFQS
ncbi:hypothetical protein ACFQI7_09615 [Paenibacillus allorhizosphaerae]|uniref:GNAT family N-acetyltransferase n=1 Tax=Paenibacillus allorhizosphaerae TaxID=2849866 RepID=A0ABM8VIP7_9BACL|nr:hypothetical protein [Paenibacillus allorhizosphaerae]CAG7644339.1 hypothetical protein PAECIP111802_03234 [Paenibacillus allorhizosphaerae]